MTVRLYVPGTGKTVAEGEAAAGAAARWVAEGGLLAHPTSTVYGIGGLPDPAIDAEIARLKGRTEGQPLIHIGRDADALTRSLPGLYWTEAARRLTARFWPGPLTLILPASDEGGVAVRVDPHPVLLDMLGELGGAMTSTSLNMTGEEPASSGDVALDVLERMPEPAYPLALLDVGELPAASPSTIVRVTASGMELVRAGDVGLEAIEACLAEASGESAVNLLFVCTGNTCRSPAAEVLAGAEARRRGASHVSVASAGTFAFPGQLAAGQSMHVARERGLDLEGHRSRELSLELIEWATHIVVMTASHATAVDQLVPGLPVALLNDFLPSDDPARGTGVADPFGGDIETYEHTYRELEVGISALFDRLVGPAVDGS